MTFTVPRVFNHPPINALKRLDGEFALRQLPKSINGDEWGGGIKRCVDGDLVSGFLVPRPSDDKSDPIGLDRVQPKIYRFVSVVHVVKVVHILEGHSEDAIAGEIDCGSVSSSGFDSLGNNLAATWFLRERSARLYIDSRELKGH